MRLFGSIYINRFDGGIFVGKPTCGGKIQYDSQHLATKQAYRMEEKNPGEIFEVYRCPFHDCWHVGHAWED